MTSAPTEAEKRQITEACLAANIEAERFQALLDHGANLELLYQAAKPVHTAALSIWSTIVDILRARKGLDQNTAERRREDAINLNELFGEKENENV